MLLLISPHDQMLKHFENKFTNTVQSVEENYTVYTDTTIWFLNSKVITSICSSSY